MVDMVNMRHLTIVWPGSDSQRGPATHLQGKKLSMLHQGTVQSTIAPLSEPTCCVKSIAQDQQIYLDGVLRFRVLLVSQKEDKQN